MKSVLQKCFMLISVAMISVGLFAQNEEVRVVWLDGEEFLHGNFYDISSNGRYAVGAVDGVYAFMWDRTTGEAVVIEGPNGTFCSADGVSDNGIIAGGILNTDYPDNSLWAAFYANGNWNILPTFPGVEMFDFNFPGAMCISDNGMIIGGMVATQVMQFSAATWTGGELDALFDGCKYSLGGKAVSMSGDGKVLCGWAYDEDDNQGAAVWNKDWTPNIKKLSTNGWAHRVSSNGKYVAGEFRPDGGETTAFLWTEESGLVEIPKPEGFKRSTATCVSNDGMVIGYAWKDLMDRTPFVYKDGNVYLLDDYLSEFYGYENESGNTFFTPMSSSASGKTICGWGETPEGKRISWVIMIGEEDSVGVSDIENDKNFNVWSNRNIINIENTSDNNVNAEVIDMTGRKIKSSMIGAGVSSIVIDNDGVYIVKIGNTAKKVVVKK